MKGPAILMKKFGKIKLNDADYKIIIDRYINFYQTHSSCTHACPVFTDREEKILGGKSIIIPIVDKLWPRGTNLTLGECFCPQLPMFPNYHCPCIKMGESAFTALEEFIKTVIMMDLPPNIFMQGQW